MNAATDKPPHEGYDSFYQSGGWRYDLTEEALRLLMGSACGVDTSTVAIARAVEQLPDTEFTCGDALEVLRGCGACDLVFVRGMSWFHDALEPGASPNPIDLLMQASFASLRSGGHFVLQIRSNFSGGYDAATGIRQSPFRSAPQRLAADAR